MELGKRSDVPWSLGSHTSKVAEDSSRLPQEEDVLLGNPELASGGGGAEPAIDHECSPSLKSCPFRHRSEGLANFHYPSLGETPVRGQERDICPGFAHPVHFIHDFR